MGFLRVFSFAMSANVIAFVLSFINNKIIYIYLINKSDIGLYFLLMRLTLLVALFCGDWIRLSTMNLAGRDKSTIPVLSANGFWYCGALGLILTSIFLLVSLFYKNAFFFIPLTYWFVVIIAGVALVGRNLWQSLLLVNRNMVSYGLTIAIWVGIFLVLDVFFLVILKYGINFVITALVVASIASAIWAFGSSMKLNGHLFRFSWNLFGESAKIGLRAWVAVVGMFIMINIHAFALQPLAGNTEEGLVMVALFSICFRVFLLFQRGSDVAGTVLYSHVIQQDKITSAKMTVMMTRGIISVSLVFSMICALVGKSLIVIIANSTYITAYYPLLIMLPGILIINTGSIINSYYWGRDYPLRIIFAPYAAAMVGLILNIVLIPRYGVSGATLSFSMMSLIWLIYQIALFKKDSGLSAQDVLVPRYTDMLYMISRIRQVLSGGVR
ncbi:polysaccharide biosynthesis C-terminal domain-containing protein [Candidatus Latescibacterota bacterium]